MPDMEVADMPRWPIRIKLIVGLSLVVAMMLTLLGGAIVGLRAYHRSNLTLTDQLRELGASKDLLRSVMQLDLDDRELELLYPPDDEPAIEVMGASPRVWPGKLRTTFPIDRSMAHRSAPADDQLRRTSGPFVTVLETEARRKELVDRLTVRLNDARNCLVRYYAELERNALRGQPRRRPRRVRARLSHRRRPRRPRPPGSP